MSTEKDVLNKLIDLILETNSSIIVHDEQLNTTDASTNKDKIISFIDTVDSCVLEFNGNFISLVFQDELDGSKLISNYNDTTEGDIIIEKLNKHFGFDSLEPQPPEELNEKAVADKLIDIILSKNLLISLSQTDEEIVSLSQDVKQIKDTLNDLDEVVIDFFHDNKSYAGYFLLVYGNLPSGEELVSDYSANTITESIMEHLQKFIEDEMSETIPTVMTGKTEIVYPGFTDHNKVAVFVSAKDIIRFTISNILSAIPKCLNDKTYSDLNTIRAEIINFIRNNKFEEFKAHCITKTFDTDDHNSSLVRLSILNKYLNLMIEKCDSINILNVSLVELNNGITSVNDPAREGGFVVSSRFSTVKDEYDFIDLGALSRNIINDFIFESQLTHKSQLIYDDEEFNNMEDSANE